MKKVISFLIVLFVVALGVTTGNSARLLIPAAPLPFIHQPLLALTAVDVSALTNFAATNQKALISTLLNGLDIANDIMVQPNVKNKIPMPKLTVGKGARPYSGTEEFHSGGVDLVYTQRYLEVKIGKRELLIDPEDYRATYLAWATTPGSSSAEKKIPFAQYMWQQVVLALQNELNGETAYYGDVAIQAKALWAGNPTTYVVGDQVKFVQNGVNEFFECISNTVADESPDTAPAKWQNITARAIVDGIRKTIGTEITATTIAPVTTGAVSATSGVAKAAFLKMFRSMPVPYKNWGCVTHASYTDYEFLLDDLLETWGKYTMGDYKGGEVPPYIVLPNTGGKGIVKPATWLGTSRRLITEPMLKGDAGARGMNLYLGTDVLSDASQITAKDSDLWTIKAGVKFALGFPIQDVSAIRVGDQA